MVLCGTNEALHFAWRRFSIWNRICKQKECYQSFSEEEHACCKSHMLALHHIRDILGLKKTWDQENKTVTRYCFMANWLKRPHQTFTVQEGRAPILGCGPFDEVDDMIQVLGEIANVFLLFTQETLMIFCNSLQKKKTKKRSAMLKQLERRHSEPQGHTILTIQITFFWKQHHSKLQDYRVKLLHLLHSIVLLHVIVFVIPQVDQVEFCPFCLSRGLNCWQISLFHHEQKYGSVPPEEVWKTYIWSVT